MPLNPIKWLLNSKNPPFLVSGVLGSEAHTDARRLRCYPAIRTSSKCCRRALDRFCIAKHGDCTQEKWKLKLWNPDFIKNLGIYIITTKSSRKRLNIGNKRRRELGKPRRCNDLVSLGPSGINLWKKLTGSWKIGTPALFCFPFSHMESEMMDVVGNWGKLKGSNPRPSGEQKTVAHLLNVNSILIIHVVLLGPVCTWTIRRPRPSGEQKKTFFCGPSSKSIALEKTHRHKYPEIAVRGGHWS